MDTTTVPELNKLSKKQLLEKIELLQTQVERPTCGEKACDVLHDLQVYEVELEMQNRELRDAQQQLEETRDNYADLYDFAPVNYISFDEKGLIENINLTGASMLGEARTNIIGRPFSRWLNQGDSTRFRKHLQTTLQSDVKVVDEVQIKNRQGKLFDVRIESIRSKYVESKRLMCRSVILDITESNRITNELFLQARQLKLITDALPVLIAYIDLNEQHLFANKTYVDSFDLLPDDVIGMSASDVWGDINYQSVSNYLKLCLAGQQVTFDMELPLGEEGKKYFQTILIPDCDSTSLVYGVIVLIGDVTDRLAIEAIDRRRLLGIAHFSRLSSMGEMASEMAHELNQPLAAISIYSDACRRMILSGKADQEQIIQSLADIGVQAERAGDVIRRIREFASKKDLQKIKIDLNELVQDALGLLEVEIRSHNVILKLALGENMTCVFVDKILIEQVVFNLIRNALEAMDEIKEPLRELQIQTSVGKLNEVEINIDDSGPGMPVDQLKKIFDAFHTTKIEGMGMGLAISHSIISAHHGRLWAVPNNHGGTTFSFTLPLIVKEDGYAT